MGIRKDQKEKRRQEILIASLDLFSSKGYAETKITDIAAAAGMSAGLLFHYFESKEALYSELLKIGIEYVSEKTKNLIKEPLDYFYCAAETLIKLMRENAEAAKIYLLIRRAVKSDNVPESIRDYIGKMAKEIFELNHGKIVLGQKQGSIKEGDSKVLTAVLFSCFDGIAESRLKNLDMPLPQAGWIVDIIKKH
ncbi:MAG TPA: TetR/AcrR family transcriptional regulator [Eubacteriales bacterium]|jgi:AcrR family transcriptional regulator|nr:TetR/AcrR family transcriptional regulator [Clostridia bacterium]HRR89301.1 TetR/AcrR family transcriptional regulator [Eubacteriales bacterium]HRU84461.1 TetR/AcrR family transcriptional regulator [Eubacteriales bacterium]